MTGILVCFSLVSPRAMQLRGGAGTNAAAGGLMEIPAGAAAEAGGRKGDDRKADGWKAGVARTVITPEEPVWMGGYAARTRPAEGTMHDLWAKALALEDASGKQVVLVTADLIGMPKEMSDAIRDRLEEEAGLSREQILLNSSHTHSGPALEKSLSVIYPQDEPVQQKIRAYSRGLVDKITGLALQALREMEPAQVYAQNGVARFQVNRRNNPENALRSLTELQGPNDYAVPVIKVENAAGELMAIAFGYACHATVLNGYEWSGDYPGFAQLELEERFPGATALFFQGAGGDQNPLPRRSEALAKQYGQTLAAAVERVLSEEMRRLEPRIAAAYTEIELAFSDPPSEAALSGLAEESSGYICRWATGLLQKIRAGEPLMTVYPYPLQVWRLGDQAIMGLGGELVVEYAIELKRIFGQDIFVLGYSNDVMGYIPSSTVLSEGGYEGATSQIGSGFPAAWEPGIEAQILSAMTELAVKAGIPKELTSKKLINGN